MYPPAKSADISQLAKFCIQWGYAWSSLPSAVHTILSRSTAVENLSCRTVINLSSGVVVVFLWLWYKCY